MRLIFIILISLVLTSSVNAKCNFNCSKDKPTSDSFKKDISSIMVGDAKSGYKFDERNVSHNEAFKMIEHQGLYSANFKLGMNMKGVKDDWVRNGVTGYAQRFEYGEQKQYTQKFDKEIWTRIVFWLPEDTVSKDQTTLFDLKEIRNNQQFGPLLNLAIRDEGKGSILKIKHNFDKNDCVIGKDGDGENSFCDKIDVNIIIGPIKKFTNRWVNFVSRAIWSNQDKGAYDAWIDDKKIIRYRGKTSFGADTISFKFGLYRIGLNKTKNPKDIEIYFTKVGTAGKCNELELTNCDYFKKNLQLDGYPNVQRVFRIDVNEKKEFLYSGGKVIKYFN